MIKRLWRGLPILVVVGNVAILAAVLWRSRGPHALPEYGAALPPARVAGVDGTETRLDEYFRRSVGILLVMPGDVPWQNLKYADVLLARYRDRGLRVAAVLPATAAERARTLSREFSSAFFVETDGFRRALGLHTRDAATFVLRPDGSVELATPHLSSRDELRQLTEKLVLGSIQYSPLTRSAALTARRSFSVIREDGGQPTEFSPAPRSEIVFISAAACAMCNMASTYDSIAGFVRAAEGTARPVVLVSEFFPIASAKLELALRDADADVLQHRGLIPELEDDYNTKWTDQMVFVLHFDETGKLATARPLSMTVQSAT